MTPTRSILTLAVAASFLLTACGGGAAEESPAPLAETTAAPAPTETEAPTGDPGPLEGMWQVTSIANEPVPDGVEVTMAFKGSEVSGSAGCNQYGAQVTATDTGQMTFGPIRSTAMACEGPVAEVEESFLTEMKKVQGYQGGDSTTSIALVDKRGVGLIYLLKA